MTFYGIIYAVVFMAAVRQVYYGVAIADPMQSWAGVVIALLAFFDTAYTSQIIDDQQVLYTVGMKFIDMINCLLLLCALVIQCPRDNLFVSSGRGAIEPPAESEAAGWYWILLLAYWLLMYSWHVLADRAPRGTPNVHVPADARVQLAPITFFIGIALFLLGYLFSWLAQYKALPAWYSHLAIAALLGIYIVGARVGGAKSLKFAPKGRP